MKALSWALESAISSGLFSCLFLYLLQQGHRTFSNSTRLKTALVEKDLMEMNGQKFYITDPLFALWFESKVQ